jgi:tetratricopeptide (TPR) repeat protein
MIDVITASARSKKGGTWFLLSLCIVSLSCSVAATACAQTPPQLQNSTTAIEGTIRDSGGQPVRDATVALLEKSQSIPVETKSDASGNFSFALHQEGTFTVTAQKSGFRKCVTDPLPVEKSKKKQLALVLQSSTTVEPMEFDDQPNFTVAGVTDYSGAGGHGSDTTLRTSEAFARETLALKSDPPNANSHPAIIANSTAGNIETEIKLRTAVAAAPNSFEANHQLGQFCLQSGKPREAIPPLKAAYKIKPDNVANSLELARAYLASDDLESARALTAKLLVSSGNDADVHRLKGDLDERSGDSLNAVREYERAVVLDPSEPNYFEWGSELLLHRAVAPAVVVFRKGSLAHPDSSRMRLGLGAALYAAGSYDDASRELCQASDLNPGDPAPYLFLGKMEATSPTLFPCIADQFSRFLGKQPANAYANYYSAMSLVKRDRESKNSADIAQAQALLEKSVLLDPKLGEAWLQLGTLYAAQGLNDQAIDAYSKAAQATPALSEPHYRLSQLYKRTGDKAKADREIQLYKQVEKTEADAAERQRREIQQFLVNLKDQPANETPR